MVQQARYQIRLQNTQGVTQAIFDDFRSLDYELRTNDFDTCTLSLDGDDSRVDLFTLDSIIQIWRKPDGAAPYVDAEFFHRTGSPQETETGLHIFTSYSRGFVDLLHRREILYTGTTAYTQKAGSGEGVMKDYVRENAGVDANSPLRKANGVTTGLSIQPDLDQGTIWRGSRGMRNLLDVLQEIALASGVDFNIIRQNDTGVPEFVFVTGYPQLGADLSTTIMFDTRLGNMIAPTYTKSRTEEANVVAVLGKGDNTSKIVIVSESPATTDSPWNRIEVSQDGSAQTTVEELFTIGEQELVKLGAKESFTFQALQTDNCQYGVHYRLGDKVTAQFKNILAIKKLTRVHITVDPGRETIQTEFADVVLGSIDPMSQVVRNINARIRALATKEFETAPPGLIF